MKRAIVLVGLFLAGCGASKEYDSNAVGEEDIVDCSTQPPPSPCEIVAVHDETGTMTVRGGETPEGAACDSSGSGVYSCELGCIRTPGRDSELCSPSRAFACAPGYVPNDCQELSDDLACCL